MSILFNRRIYAAIAATAVLAVVAFNLLGGSSVDVSTGDSPELPEPTVEVLSAQETAEAEAETQTRGLQVDGVNFTGDAEVDLPEGSPDVVVIPDIAGGIAQRDLQAPIPQVSPQGDIGWDIQDVRVRYIAATDELIIGLNSYGIVGDPEGNFDPASFDPEWIAAGAPGDDIPDLGELEGATIGLDLDEDGTFDIAIGTHWGNTINEFGVFTFNDFGQFIPLTPGAYGAPAGELAQAPINPSEESPDLVFSIANFSQLPGSDGSLNFGINAAAGSGADGNIGEDSIGTFAVPVPVELESRLGDFVFEDTNSNGIQDAGEPGIESVFVTLLDQDGVVIDETNTDADGFFEFIVPSGTFAVEFDAPEGTTFTQMNAGDDRAVDSNADPATGRTAMVFIAPGDEDLTIDAGIIPFTPAPSINIEKATNGQDADNAPGVELIVGEEATFTFVATNDGNIDLTDIEITDNVLGDICTHDRLTPGESVTCTETATVAEGQATNVATVDAVGENPDGTPAGPVTDDDPSNHIGIVPFIPAPSIVIEKATNGQDADEATGPELVVGEEATFTFVATNDGNVDLVDVVITDNILGDICTHDRLAPGESVTCEETATVEEGQHTNVATVDAVGENPDGSVGDPVTDDDPSNHIGIVPGPPCVVNIRGPRMFHGSTVRDETGLVAAPGAEFFVITDEPGGSPDQPNEQVYFMVGEELHGPTPVGLGEFGFTTTTGGPITVLHHSVVTGDTSLPNSVEYEWCATDFEEALPDTVYTCPTSITGPRMFKGSTVRWDSGLIAAAGSTIEITTSEPGGSPGQPHEQVYVFIGDEQFGPTPNEHGTTVYTATEGGLVRVVHFSEFNETSNPNSVEFTICGSSLTEAS